MTPLVVVWGRYVEGLPLDVDGVQVIHGRDLRDVLRSSRAAVDDQIVRSAIEAIVELKQMRELYERKGQEQGTAA